MSDSFLYYHIFAPDTYTVCPKPCILHSIIVNTTAADLIGVDDGTGNIVAVLKANIAEGTYYYDVDIKNSLIVTTLAPSDITVTYKPSA